MPTFSPHSLLVADRSFPKKLGSPDSRLDHCPSFVPTAFGGPMFAPAGDPSKIVTPGTKRTNRNRRHQVDCVGYLPQRGCVLYHFRDGGREFVGSKIGKVTAFLHIRPGGKRGRTCKARRLRLLSRLLWRMYFSVLSL